MSSADLISRISDADLRKCARAARNVNHRDPIVRGFAIFGQMAQEELERRKEERKSTTARREPREGSFPTPVQRPAAPLVASSGR